MKPITAALARAATGHERPAFDFVLMIIMEKVENNRVALGALINVFDLFCDAVAATHDIATGTVVYLRDVDENHYPINPEQAATVIADSEIIIAALSQVESDKPGRAKVCDVQKALVAARQQ